MTRLIQTIPGVENRPQPKEGEFNTQDPGNVSPFVAYLATEDCPIKGRVFFVGGRRRRRCSSRSRSSTSIHKDGRWTVEELEKEAAHFADVEFDLGRAGTQTGDRRRRAAIRRRRPRARDR